jgi:hypothetical protein
VVAVQYTFHNRQTYSIKWAWNALQPPNSPRIIASAQFHLFAEPHYKSPTFKWHHERWKPTERYFGPVSEYDYDVLKADMRGVCAQEDDKVATEIFGVGSALNRVTEGWIAANPTEPAAKKLGMTLTSALLRERHAFLPFSQAPTVSSTEETKEQKDIRAFTTRLRQLPLELKVLIFENICPVDTQRHYLDLDRDVLINMSQREIDQHIDYQRTNSFRNSYGRDDLSYRRYRAIMKPYRQHTPTWMGWNYYRKAYINNPHNILTYLLTINNPADAFTMLHLPNFMDCAHARSRYDMGYYTLNPIFIGLFPWEDPEIRDKFHFYWYGLQ